MNTLIPCDVSSFVAQSHTPCNRCVRFVTTVARDHATLATKRTLLLTWAGLPPAGSHQLAAGALRGRDASYLAPPAQIRTCGFPAYGSHLGCVTAKRTQGSNCRKRSSACDTLIRF